jgi:isopentenyl-diphosphate Delta-isomerase
MPNSNTTKRKKDHIQLCLTNEVEYKSKTNGFENYVFEHCAITEVELDKINFASSFFDKKINFPFLISCMTGGTKEAGKINEQLGIAAKELNIPIGVGSQRQALENTNLHSTYKTIRKSAGSVPVLGNIGAAQIVKSKNVIDEIKFLIDLVEADAMVAHVNPLQELLQPEGETNFSGLLKGLENICSKITIPIIVKEVGSGINKESAKKLLDVGVKGIDVAGAGGTSWAAVELKRVNRRNDFLREWGLPTSYCVRTVNELKNNYNFMLIASGGINSGIDIAKAISLGADLTASARIILQEVNSRGVNGVIRLVQKWFSVVKDIMYLTNCSSVEMLRNTPVKRKEELY